jgi:hypothetical protein
MAEPLGAKSRGGKLIRVSSLRPRTLGAVVSWHVWGSNPCPRGIVDSFIDSVYHYPTLKRLRIG